MVGDTKLLRKHRDQGKDDAIVTLALPVGDTKLLREHRDILCDESCGLSRNCRRYQASPRASRLMWRGCFAPRSRRYKASP